MVDQATLDQVIAGQLEPQTLNLSGANLCGLDLSRRNFFATDLSGADLSGADLRWANLMYADLRGAKLDGADFFGASTKNARIDDRDGVDRCAAGVTGPYKTPNPDTPVEDHRVPEDPQIVAFFFDQRPPIDRRDTDRVEADSAIGSIRPL